MASKKPAPAKKQAKASKKPKQSSKQQASTFSDKARTKLNGYLKRRPHRSFRRTLRRDYVRSLSLPGYNAFTLYVTKTLLAHKRLFGSLVAFYVIAGALLVGVASQESYSQLSQLLTDTGSDVFDGGWGAFGQAGLLLFTSLSGGLNPAFTEAQQIYSALLLLLVWLAVVWALRAQLAGNAPKLRDVLYNSGAPIVGTAVVLLIAVIQLIPIALAVVIVNSAAATGMFDSPTMSLVISVGVGGLGLLSIYWITSTMIAMVIITLPGMYPWRAIQAAGDLVIGRRLRILLRLIWMVVILLLFSVLVLLPAILIDRALKQAIPAIDWVPFVPLVMAVVSAIGVVWSATYVYLLYRKVVEDDADPA